MCIRVGRFLFAFGWMGIFATPAMAIQVAFITLVLPNGLPLQVEPGNRFTHVAISATDGHWVHAHPKNGVEAVTDLRPFGQIDSILENPSLPDIDLITVIRLSGLAYDEAYDWADNTAFYCSELVAKLLKLSPVSMHFDPKVWFGKSFPEGALGISPFGIYQTLLKTGGWAEVFPKPAFDPNTPCRLIL